MPLNLAGLQSALASFFAAPPVIMSGDVCDLTASRAACAQEWADAMQTYAAAVTPPSATVAAACATLSSALASAFALPSASAAVDAAFIAFAATVGGGMAPGFIATPPATPPGFASGMGVNAPSHAAAAATWAGRIDTWMRTGTAVPVPPGPAVPWA
jgi:hypothetical protein